MVLLSKFINHLSVHRYSQIWLFRAAFSQVCHFFFQVSILGFQVRNICFQVSILVFQVNNLCFQVCHFFIQVSIHVFQVSILVFQFFIFWSHLNEHHFEVMFFFGQNFLKFVEVLKLSLLQKLGWILTLMQLFLACWSFWFKILDCTTSICSLNS